MTKRLLREYTTEQDVLLKLKPVRMVTTQTAVAIVEQEWRDRGEPIDAPTYQIKTVAGEIEEHELTEELLADESAWTPEEMRTNRAKWSEHRKALARLQEAQAEKQMKVMIGLGIDCEVPDDGWEDELAYAGITVPDNPIDRKFYYIWHVATSPFDKGQLQAQLQLVNAGKIVTEADLDRFQGSVQSALAGPVRAHIEKTLQDVERQLVADSEAMGDGDGSELGADPEAVG